MKNLLKVAAIAGFSAFAAFAWLSLPSLDTAQPHLAGGQTAQGKGLLLHVDQQTGMVTVRHDAIPALNMSAMTMAFVVADRNFLADLQPMQNIEFTVLYDGRDYLLADIRHPSTGNP
jgi:Cu/Ag efflux protein CusF